MLRLFGWMVAGGVLLGCASAANAQVSQSVANPSTGTGVTFGVPGAGYGYSGVNAYGNPSAQGPGNSAYSRVPLAGTTYNPGYAGNAAPAAGVIAGCFTTYPLSTTYPYSYTGPGSGFGAYKYIPYPYAPFGYGWYGGHWRGW